MDIYIYIFEVVFNVTKMKEKKRPSSQSSPQIGALRHELYKAAIDAYKDALMHHYNVEAITLVESLISDRMESLANLLSENKDYSNKTLGELIGYLRSQNLELIEESLSHIDGWRKKRNDAIHQLAKCLEPDFKTHYNSTRQTALDGMKCFREFDKQYKIYLRINK